MKFSTLTADKLAVSFSTVCAIHCLATPFLVALLPSLAALPLEAESFHLWMVIAVLPTSVYALTLGCKKHKQRSVLRIGIVGLVFLISALAFGESFLGEWGEKGLTVLGAIIIAFAHFKNFRLCQEKEKCPCPNSKSGA